MGKMDAEAPEITPAMIRAGLAELAAFDPTWGSQEAAEDIRRIYGPMERARKTSLSKKPPDRLKA